MAREDEGEEGSWRKKKKGGDGVGGLLQRWEIVSRDDKVVWIRP